MIFLAAFPLVPFVGLIVAAIVALAFVIGIALIWDKEPWWRKSPKPSRELKNVKELVKIHKVRTQHPDAFIGIPEYIPNTTDIPPGPGPRGPHDHIIIEPHIDIDPKI